MQLPLTLSLAATSLISGAAAHTIFVQLEADGTTYGKLTRPHCSALCEWPNYSISRNRRGHQDAHVRWGKHSDTICRFSKDFRGLNSSTAPTRRDRGSNGLQRRAESHHAVRQDHPRDGWFGRDGRLAPHHRVLVNSFQILPLWFVDLTNTILSRAG